MKSFLTFLALIGMLFLSHVAFAQTRISQAKTAQYVQSCLKNSEADTITSPNTKNIFCQCTGQFMQRNLTMEDLKAMGGKGQTQRNAMNKMVTGVYAPCMEFPVRDMIQKQCMTDVKQLSVCQCLSKNMAAYTAKSAQTQLSQVLAKTPNAFDPMGAIIDSPEFQKQQKQITMQCLTGKLK
jgi:hypothetical protein